LAFYPKAAATMPSLMLGQLHNYSCTFSGMIRAPCSRFKSARWYGGRKSLLQESNL